MTNEKWQSITGHIKDNFEVEDEGNEHVDEDGGIDIEYMVFKGPLGTMRLEYITQPVILDKKTNYSKRIGSETDVKYIYSETEKTSKMLAYKWNEDDEEWMEIDASNFIS